MFDDKLYRKYNHDVNGSVPKLFAFLAKKSTDPLLYKNVIL